MSPNKVTKLCTEGTQSEMYDPFAPRVNGKRVDSSLSVRDPKAHDDIRKPVAKAYSMTNTMDYEPLVDKTIIKLLQRLRESETAECDIGLWMRLCMYRETSIRPV
jgi:cytochrome P450